MSRGVPVATASLPLSQNILLAMAAFFAHPMVRVHFSCPVAYLRIAICTMQRFASLSLCVSMCVLTYLVPGVPCVPLSFVTGVVEQAKFPAFERVLWRACRGNVFLRRADIEEELKDPKTNQPINKVVFIAFFQVCHTSCEPWVCRLGCLVAQFGLRGCPPKGAGSTVCLDFCRFLWTSLACFQTSPSFL